MNGIRDKNFFLSFSAYLISFWLKILTFFAIFFGSFLLGLGTNRIRDKFFFFFSFSAYLIPFWLKIMPERGFLIFLLFFSEFSSQGRVWTEIGTKIFFSLFCSLSTPVLALNNSGKRYLNFLIFFFYFFRNFLARAVYELNSGLNFFSLFLAYLILFWLKIMPERGF